jgi:hypothetical protein
MNMDLIYGLLAIIVVGTLCVMWLIRPLLVECWGIMMLPIGAGMQWIACRAQEAARLLWMAGRKLEQNGKIYRRAA